MDKKRTIWWIILSSVTSILIIINLVGAEKGWFHPKELKELCKERGHDKLTDFSEKYEVYTWNKVTIECDYNNYYSFEKQRQCAKKDKWGDCVSWKPWYIER